MKKKRFILLFFIIALFSVSVANEKMVFISKILKNFNLYEYLREYASIRFHRTDHFKNNESKPYITYLVDKRNNLMIILDHIGRKYAEVSNSSKGEIYGYKAEDIADFISEAMELEESGYEELKINGKKVKVMIKKSHLQGIAFSVLNLTDLFSLNDSITIFEIFCGKPISKVNKNHNKKQDAKKGFLNLPVKIYYNKDYFILTETIKLIDYNQGYFDIPKDYKKVSIMEIFKSQYNRN
ncbi:MAG: hypothetical protein N2169_01170 [bacterium]|nr:hypothetical protein [bacterium]